MSLKTITHRQLILAAALALFIFARPASAQLTFTFDEAGNGTIIRPNVPTITLISLGNLPDPFDASSGLKPLTYDIFGSLGVVPRDGDINLSDNTGALSDLLRFENGRLLVYSDQPTVGELFEAADVGFSQLRQSNLINLAETGPEVGPNGLFGYSPGPGQPGELSAPTVYNFISDPAVPEPSSFAVAGLGALVLLVRRRRALPASQPA
jgi:hypothetical protein